MIIGLSGYAQSGKDTVANILVENYGYTRVAFADKIRDFLYDMNPMVDNVAGEPIFLKERVDRDGWEVAKKNPHIRRTLQNAGVAARKNFGEDFWVDQALASIFQHENTVITDVRFINEAEMVRHQDGQIWRIKRLGVTAVNGHVSEQEMDGYPVDQIFTNNSSIEDLELMVKTRMMSLV
jgi:cytidylate kinase